MDIAIHARFLTHDDPDAALAFHRDTLGFEVRDDVGNQGMRWITVGPADQPGVSIVLHPPGVDPGITEDARRTVVETMAKGTCSGTLVGIADLDATSSACSPTPARSSRSRPSGPAASATSRSATPPAI